MADIHTETRYDIRVFILSTLHWARTFCWVNAQKSLFAVLKIKCARPDISKYCKKSTNLYFCWSMALEIDPWMRNSKSH